MPAIPRSLWLFAAYLTVVLLAALGTASAAAGAEAVASGGPGIVRGAHPAPSESAVVAGQTPTPPPGPNPPADSIGLSGGKGAVAAVAVLLVAGILFGRRARSKRRNK